MIILRATLREMLGRRVLLWGGILSVAFIGLFTLGLTMISRELGTGADEVEIVGTMLALLALYVVSFLGAFLGLALSAGAVASEIDQALIHAVAARPITRRSWLLQRWTALAAVVGVYVAVMSTVMMLLATSFLSYQPLAPIATVALMALEAVVMTTIGLLFSTRVSAVAAGVITFSAFGLAWLAGIVEFIGSLLGNSALVNTGIITSLVVPTDELWRGASFYAANASFVDTVMDQVELPFASGTPPAGPFLLWSVAYILAMLWLATRWFERRDL